MTMSWVVRPLLFGLLAVCLWGCNQSEEQAAEIQVEPPVVTTPDETPPDWVSVDQGIWGQVLFWEGDFMPGAVTGTKTPVVRAIYIHEATTSDQVTETEPYSTFYSYVDTPLVQIVYSDENGYFQAQLAPGKYSIFVDEEEGLYASRFERDIATGTDTIFPVTVKENDLGTLNIDITYASAY